jgi:hypothetical protein
LGTGRTNAPSELKLRLSSVENDRAKIIYFTISPYFDVLLKLIKAIAKNIPMAQKRNI